MTKEVQKWADQAMFKADPIDQDQGPQVTLLSCNADPLGTIAAAALMYEGKSVTDLSQITDVQRRHYLDDVRKSALAAPLEFVNFHFLISGVTRGFTHQMVRQRTATYTQESTRFAVKEDVPVGRPPSLDGTMPWNEWIKECGHKLYPGGTDWSHLPAAESWPKIRQVDKYAEQQATKEQGWRKDWDECTNAIEETYNKLVNAGMPAEDARGLLPTNLLTRINYNTSLRGLLEHAGVRLCTQAQYEWRLVWTKMLQAIRDYGFYQTYSQPEYDGEPDPEYGGDGPGIWGHQRRSGWQFDALAAIFKPICYQKGSCQFLSDVDRHCNIRPRVQQNAKAGRASVEWGQPDMHYGDRYTDDHVKIPAIKDEEWMLDPIAARISQ